MASQPVIEAARRESKANAREDMAVLTSGAREKVDGAMASAQAFGQSLLHPMDKKKREEVQANAEQQKQAARDKRDDIRSVATQQAATERAAARGVVAKGVAETGGARYPVLSPDPPQQSVGPDGVAADTNENPNHPAVTPNHPSVTDEPYYDRSDVLHAQGQPGETREEPLNESLTSEGRDVQTEAPKPVDGLSRENIESGKSVDDANTKGVEDADFYPEPRIVKT